MRLATLATVMALGAAWCAPAMAQTAPATGNTLQNHPAVPSNAPKTAAPAMAASSLSAPVNINTATAAELDKVPQIGPKRAAAIIKNRPYKTIDELVSKKALSNGVFKKVKSHLTV